MFTLKKWLWTQWQKWRGADRAYAKYLAHFAHYQTQVVSTDLQDSIGLQPMSKQAFLAVWQKKGLTKSKGTSCGCNSGCSR